MKADNQKTKLYTGLGVMVLASIAVVACTEPAYNALNKAGRVEKTEHIYTPGTYEGEAQGFGGAVKASVTVDEVYITELKLTGEADRRSGRRIRCNDHQRCGKRSGRKSP